MFQFIFFAAAGVILHASLCQCLQLTPSDKPARVHIPHFKSARIINGALADIKQFPYVVSLQNNGTFYGHDYEHYCCGSIINERWIITTAQCGQARQPSDFHVRVGSTEYYTNGTIYKVEKVLVHPKFKDPQRDYDVALIKLTEKIAFSEYVKPVELPKVYDTVQESTNFAIVGWGSSKLLGKMSDQLLSSHVKKIGDDSCRLSYGSSTITDRMFCVFSQGFGPCVGDSGSPALFQNKLIGLASWSYGCAYDNPAVYLKISSVLGWIKSRARCD